MRILPEGVVDQLPPRGLARLAVMTALVAGGVVAAALATLMVVFVGTALIQ